MKLYKKAQDVDTGVVKNAILVLIVLVILIYFFVMPIIKEMMHTAVSSNCKESIKNNAHLRLKVLGTDLSDMYGNVAEIKCNTNYEKITSKDNNIIKQELANKMYDVWDTYGKGELEIFDTKDNVYCVVADVISFSKKDVIKDFSYYLLTQYVPGKDFTYYDYFAASKSSKAVLSHFEDSDLKNLDSLDLSKDKAIVFVMNKDAHLGKLAASTWFAQNIGWMMGAAGGSGATTGTRTYLLASRLAKADAAMSRSLATKAAYTDVLYTTTGDATITMDAVSSATQSVNAGKFINIGKGVIKGVRTVGSTMLVLTLASSATGLYFGSDVSSSWDARILLIDYLDVGKLGCTYLEGNAGALKVKEKIKN